MSLYEIEVSSYPKRNVKIVCFSEPFHISENCIH
jgi:hypothetical protein